MKILFIYFVIFCEFHQAVGEISVLDNQALDIPRYISSVIGAESKKDRSRYHDVVLVRLNIATENDLFGDILNVVKKDNPSNAILVHYNIEPLSHRCIAVASLIVVVTDIEDSVRSHKLSGNQV